MQHGELIALALLSAASMHPYEINKRIDSMRIRQWAKLGSSTLYPVLNRLSKKGFVSHKQEFTNGRPPRKVYSITTKGKKALERLIVEGLNSPTAIYSDRIVAAVFCDSFINDKEGHFSSAFAQLRDTRIHLRKAMKLTTLSQQGRVILNFQLATVNAELEALRALSRLKSKQDSRPAN